MKRDPNSDIPGFEGEYYGTVGNEKAIHHTHFHIKHDLDVRGEIVGYEWVKVGAARWKLVRKPIESAMSAAQAGGK